MYLNLMKLFLCIDVIDPDEAVVAVNAADNVRGTCKDPMNNVLTAVHSCCRANNGGR